MCMYTTPTSTSASISASQSPAHQVVIKVSDEAGGIARSQLADVWMYNSWRLRGGGTGMGLPLARLYAMYFGGSLQLFPMEGRGGMALSAHPGSAPLGSARARLLRLLRARPAALGGSTLLGEAITPLGAQPPPRVLERVASQGHRFHHLLTTPGYGTDAYATFNRLGDANSEHCLNAPIVAGDEDGFAPSEVRDDAPAPTRPEPGHGAVP